MGLVYPANTCTLVQAQASPSNGYGYAFPRTSYGGYASLSYGYVLTRTTEVDMFTTAMGMDMLLLNTDMDRPLPGASYGGYASPDHNHGYASLNYRQQHHGPGYEHQPTGSFSRFRQGGKLLEAKT